MKKKKKVEGKLQVGDFVHFVDDSTVIYEVVKSYPVWYKGKKHITLRKSNQPQGFRFTTTSATQLIVAEPELLI
jgi:hypothetical protein